VSLVLAATLAVVSPSSATWEEFRVDYLAERGATYIDIKDQDALSAGESELQQRRIYLEAQALEKWEDAQVEVTPDGVRSGADYSVGPFAIPTYIVMCESGGNYLAENDYSTASGAYQIIDSSWAGYGGYSHASDAPPAVQDAKAALMWAGGAGISHWAACA
jgi:transglycosylase-like protein